MGQQSSVPISSRGQKNFSTSSPPARPKSPPSRPLTPKTPNYVVPENRVLPNGVADMEHARKLLRPVSQELSKFHPEFADIFPYDQNVSFDSTNGSSLDQNSNINKENARMGVTEMNMNPGYTDKTFSNGILNGHGNELVLNEQISNGVKSDKLVTNGSISNGHILNNHRIVNNVSNGDISSLSQSSPRVIPKSGIGLRRSHSLERDRPSGARHHRRQSSLTPLTDAVIHEDPREHLYNVARQEPFSNIMPSTTSLPVQNSFELEYTFNLTYAQLAEHRRQKRQENLEKTTGRRLEELGAEIRASSTVPKSPFDRNNLGVKSSTPSVSTGSSDTGVSKSKKKRAPAPPPPTGGALRSRDSSPGKMSLSTEPPADYEMDVVADPILNRRHSAQFSPGRSRSRMLPKSFSEDRLQIRNNVNSSNTPDPPGSTPMPSVIPPAPPLPAFASSPEIKTKPDTSKTLKLHNSSLDKSIFEAKVQLEALKRLEGLEGILKSRQVPEAKPTSVAETEQSGNTETKITVERETIANTNGTEDLENIIRDPTDNTTSVPLITPNNPSQDGRPDSRKMSSLLQHDIVLAAQARGSKLKKTKPPATLEKPKDPADLFREELAKVASEREQRRKDVKIDENASDVKSKEVEDDNLKDPDTVFQTDFLKVSKKSINSRKPQEARTSELVNVTVHSHKPTATEKDEPNHSGHYDDRVDIENGADKEDEMESVTSSNGSQRVFPPSWTPEDDLDPDDDILDDSVNLSARSVSNEGFKASIVPNSMKELKSSKKKKIVSKKKKQTPEHVNMEKTEVQFRKGKDDDNDRAKFGSIRKFRKSVHEGVRNAFGSISKASGKLLKRRKSQDFLDISQEPISPDCDIPPADRDSNWELVGNGKGSLKRTTSDGSITYNGVHDSDTSDSGSDIADDVGDIDFASGIDDDPPRSSQPSDSQMRKMKRAGVAYFSKNGQIIVLPEYHNVSMDSGLNNDEGRAPRLFKKKGKKYTYESTVRIQEKKRVDDEVSREIWEKEQQIAVERQRQQEMEKDFRKLRDLETQERLQRLQTASLREQISLLQQQQIQRAHVDLNTSTVHPQYVSPLAHNHNVQPPQPQYHVSGLSQPMIPTNGYVSHSAPLVSGGSMPTLNGQELSHLSECMRLMGVTPPATQHQWALLLSTISVNNPGMTSMPPNVFPNSLSSLGSGPDLSNVLSSKDNLKKQIFDVPNGQRLPHDAMFYKNILQNVIDTSNNGLYQGPVHQPPFSAGGQAPHSVHQQTLAASSAGLLSSSSSPTAYPATQLQEFQSMSRIQELPVTQVSGGQAVPVSSSEVQSNNTEYGSNDRDQQAAGGQLNDRSTNLTAKVYGPMGYRPVVFTSGPS